MATYEYSNGTNTKSIVSVNESKPMQIAVIPIHMDSSAGKQPAYSIANPNGRSISVNLVLTAQDGTVVDDSKTISLGPGEQIARYLLQDVSLQKFMGSLVLRGNGQGFVAFAVLDKQGLLTAIPLVPIN